MTVAKPKPGDPVPAKFPQPKANAYKGPRTDVALLSTDDVKTILALGDAAWNQSVMGDPETKRALRAGAEGKPDGKVRGSNAHPTLAPATFVKAGHGSKGKSIQAIAAHWKGK